MQRTNRKYKLTVGLPPTKVIFTPIVSEAEVFGANLIPSDGDYRIVKLNAVEITDLDIVGNVTSRSGAGNTGKTQLQIFNLAPETLEIVEKNNNYVILEAGYSGEELSIIFTGQVSDFNTQRQGQDVVTTLVCGDGYIPNNTIRLSKSFPANTKANTVMEYLIQRYKDSGIALGEYVPQIDTKEKVEYIQLAAPDITTFSMGYSLSGYLSDELRDLCESLGYVNYITNGRLFIHPKSYAKTTERFIYSTDQLYSVRKSSSTTSTTNSKQDTGVEVTMQLDGRLGVDKQIEIQDGDFAGIYKILNCNHAINYRDGAFDTQVSCKRLEA